MAKWVLCIERLPDRTKDYPVVVEEESRLDLWSGGFCRGKWDVYGYIGAPKVVAWLDGVPEFKGER